jgi:nucleotide-binding universal stress UspA family protein
MNTRFAERPPVGALGADGDGPHWNPSLVLVLLERPSPTPWSLRQLAWFARRLQAELLIATVVTYDRSLDDYDQVKVRIAKQDVQKVTARLVEQGARATGEVRLVRCGDQALSASDLADGLDADLVIVLARRGSWFGLFPGSPLAHQLMRRRRRPVLVIPDHERRGSRLSFFLELVRGHERWDDSERGKPAPADEMGPTGSTAPVQW